MHLRASLTKFWAYSSMLLVTGIILFLFGYVFTGGRHHQLGILSQPPRERYWGGRRNLASHCGEPVLYGDSHCPGRNPCCCHSTLYGVLLQRTQDGGINPHGNPVYFGNPVHCPGTVCLQLPGAGPGLGALHPVLWCGSGRDDSSFYRGQGRRPSGSCQNSWYSPPMPWAVPGFTPSERLCCRPARGDRVGRNTGRLLRHGGHGPLIFTGQWRIPASPARLSAPAMALPMHLYLLVAQEPLPWTRLTGLLFMMALIYQQPFATIYARRSQKKWNIS